MCSVENRKGGREGGRERRSHFDKDRGSREWLVGALFSVVALRERGRRRMDRRCLGVKIPLFLRVIVLGLALLEGGTGDFCVLCLHTCSRKSIWKILQHSKFHAWYLNMWRNKRKGKHFMMSAKVYKIPTTNNNNFDSHFFRVKRDIIFPLFSFRFPAAQIYHQRKPRRIKKIFSQTDPEKTGKVQRDGSSPVERLFIFHLRLLLLVDTQNRHTQDEGRMETASSRNGIPF